MYSSRKIPAILLWGSVLLLALLAQPALSKTPVKPASSSFWNTNVRLCGVDADGNCHTESYVKSIARFAVPGVVLAALTLLCFVFFLPIRFCCNGCGGQNPSHGFCPDRVDKRQYKRKEIIYTKIATAVVLIPIIIAIAIGFQSNTAISSSITNVTSTIAASGDKILSDLLQVQTTVQNLAMQFNQDSSDQQTIQNVLTKAVSTAKGVDDDLHNAQDVGHRYDKARSNMMIVGFSLCVVVVVLSLLAIVFNLRILSMTLAMFSFFIVIIIWLSFSLHLVADKFVYDVCVDVNLLTSNTTQANTTSVFKSGALARFWACNNNSNFMSLESVINQEIDFSADALCSVRNYTCLSDANWICSPTPICNQDTVLVATDGSHLRIRDCTTTRNLSDCAKNCENSQYQANAQNMTQLLGYYTNFTNVYYETVLPILECKTAENVFRSLQSPLCMDMFNSMYGVAVASIVLAVFFTIFIAMLILGFKRFQSFNEGII